MYEWKGVTFGGGSSSIRSIKMCFWAPHLCFLCVSMKADMIVIGMPNGSLRVMCLVCGLEEVVRGVSGVFCVCVWGGGGGVVYR